VTVVEFPDGKSCYMDNNLYERLQKTKKRVKRDEDRVFIVDGPERTGKSTFTQQKARVLDPSFTHERMCMTVPEFREAIENANKYQAIVFDEGFRGFSSRNTMTVINKILVTKMMEIGQKNLFIFIVLPTFFMLESYVVLHRATGLFNVYKRRNQRGYWKYYNKNKLKRLYVMGKKFHTYAGKNFPKPNFRGRFLDQYVINEKAYRKKKLDSFKQSEMDIDNQPRVGAKYFNQRNMLLAMLKKKYNMTQEDISKFCENAGFKLDRSAVGRSIQSLHVNQGKF